MLRKRFLAAAFLLSVLFVLAGCTGSKSKQVKTSAQAKGRYVEETVKLPYEEGESNSQTRFYQREDGTIILYRIQYEENENGGRVYYSTYLYDGQGWLPQYDVRSIDLMGQLSFARQTNDGTDYLLFTDYSEYVDDVAQIKSVLFQFKADGSQKTYLDESVKKVESSSLADSFHVKEDGSVILSTRDYAMYFDEGGNEISKMPQAETVLMQRNLSASNDTDYVTSSPDSQELLRYNMFSGDVEERISLSEVSSELDPGSLMVEKNGDLYMCNSEGLHYWKKGGSVWETLIDGALNSLSMPKKSPAGIFKGSEEDYYIELENGMNGYSLLHFKYNPELSSVPSKVLNVYGLDDFPTIRQAITVFQKNNPDVMVRYQVGDGGSGNASLADTIKALNTELLNKKGADVIILDGLPVEDYIEKGILADLSEIINPMIDDKTIHSNVGNSWKKDGGIYGVPARYGIPVLYGTKEGIEALKSLQDLVEYCKNNQDFPLMKELSAKQLSEIFMKIYDNELRTDSGVSEENLKYYLEAVKLLAASEQPNGEEDSGDLNLYYIDNKLSAVDYKAFSSVYELMVPCRIITKNAFEMSTANSVYYPLQNVAVNKAGAQQELAQEFVRTLLSEEVQKGSFSDGFPVNEDAFESWLNDDYSGIVVGYGFTAPDGTEYMIDGQWPEKALVERFKAIKNEVSIPLMQDRVLTSIINEESYAYFNGNADLDTVVAAILNKVSLYMAE